MKITRRQLRQLIREQMDVTVGTGPGSEADKLVELLKDIAAPGWIRDLLADGLTPDQIRARAQQGLEASRAWMRDEDEDEYARPDYEGGEDRGLAAREYQEGPRNREKRLDIVDGDTGEIHAQWDDPDNWNDEPFGGMYADFVIWLGKNEEDYERHPDSESLAQKSGNTAWYVRHKDTDLRTDHRTPPSQLVGKYNLPSTDWGIPEPDRGTTSEGTSFDEMPASWQQILRDVV